MKTFKQFLIEATTYKGTLAEAESICKSIINDMKSIGGGEFNHNNIEINAKHEYVENHIRDFGKWGTPEQHEEDYDWMNLQTDWNIKLDKLVKEYIKRFPAYIITVSQQEKRYISVNVKLKDLPVSANAKKEYLKGSFGYWWTIEQKKEDIEGKVYSGDINCMGLKLTSLNGAPKEVKGSFNCAVNHLTSLEGCPNKVDGDFSCSHNNLTTLKGCPEKVGGDFDIGGNELKSLKGCPEKINGKFYCGSCNLDTLEGAPKKVGGTFNCALNNLTSLKGCPKEVGKTFDCNNNNLTTLKGCPEKVGVSFMCNNNSLTSLEGCPKEIKGNFNCSHNNLTSLKGCPEKVDRDFDCTHNSIVINYREPVEYAPKKVGGYFNGNDPKYYVSK